MGKASAIYLYGPPASGKTTLGARLARALRRDFIDLDAEIERRTGRHIPDIFHDDGEARIIVSPPPDAGSTFFMRVKVK